jgi:GxxExxY protein
MTDLDGLVEALLGMAAEVRRHLGPGLAPAAYEAALCMEMDEAGLKYRRGVDLPMLYKGRPLGEFRLDLLVEEALAIGIQAGDRREVAFPPQILTTLRIAGRKAGLLIDFGARLLREGITRILL